MKITEANLEKAILNLKQVKDFALLKEPSTKFLELSKNYLNLLLLWNKTHDLVGPPKSIEDFLLTHFTDSIAAFHICNKDRPISEISYMDIGTGAGIPGFFWYFLYQDWGFEINTILLEPREKRAHFLEEVMRELDLNNVRVVKERVEQVRESEIQTTDIFTLRAIKLTSTQLKYLNKYSPHAKIFWLAGTSVDQEGSDLNIKRYNISESDLGRRAIVELF